jgi:hypothetical protein
MRKLVVALCLLMAASTGNAQFLPRGPTYQQVLFEVCLRKGFNADYCECWANHMSSILRLTPQESVILQLYGTLPPYTRRDQIWANARCENPLTPDLSVNASAKAAERNAKYLL